MKKFSILLSCACCLFASSAIAGDFGMLKKLIDKSDLDGLKRAIKAGANVNDHSGILRLAPLAVAVAGQNIKLVEALVAAGADVNDKNRFGNSALHQAAIDNSVEIAEYLIDHGADINAEGANGLTPLIYAASSPDVAILLIERGADYAKTPPKGVNFVEFVEAYSKDGSVLEKLRSGAQATKKVTFPIIERIEHEKQTRAKGEDPFKTLVKDLVAYFSSPEGRALKALGAGAIQYLQSEASRYEPPAESRLSDFSDWREHADHSRHREATLFCSKPTGIVVEIEEHYSASGKHWFQRDAGAVLLPKSYDTLSAAISIECSTGSGLIDHDRNQQLKNH